MINFGKQLFFTEMEAKCVVAKIKQDEDHISEKLNDKFLRFSSVADALTHYKSSGLEYEFI